MKIYLVNTKKLFPVILFIGSMFFISTDNFAYPSSDSTQNNVFENLMTIDIHDQSAILVAFTAIPLVCEIEYDLAGNNLSESIMVLHEKEPHTAHIVKISELLSETEYEYRFMSDVENEKSYSKIMSFKTLE